MQGLTFHFWNDFDSPSLRTLNYTLLPHKYNFTEIDKISTVWKGQFQQILSIFTIGQTEQEWKAWNDSYRHGDFPPSKRREWRLGGGPSLAEVCQIPSLKSTFRRANREPPHYLLLVKSLKLAQIGQIQAFIPV
jgi:hypothetical protein